MSLKDQGENKAVSNPSYAALQLDALEALCDKWSQALGGRSTEVIKSYVGQHTDWVAAQPALYTDMSRQKDPGLSERHQRLSTRANTLRSLSVLALAKRGEGGYLMGGVSFE